MNAVNEFQHKLHSHFLLLLMHMKAKDLALLNTGGIWVRDNLYTLTRVYSLH